jgi:hypothetical protein
MGEEEVTEIAGATPGGRFVDFGGSSGDDQ